MYFLEFAFLRNRWVWFHILAGAFLAKVMVYFLMPYQVVGIIFTIAYLWEILELWTTDVERKYGNKKIFFLDAFGDILGALLAAIIVVW